MSAFERDKVLRMYKDYYSEGCDEQKSLLARYNNEFELTEEEYLRCQYENPTTFTKTFAEFRKDLHREYWMIEREWLIWQKIAKIENSFFIHFFDGKIFTPICGFLGTTEKILPNGKIEISVKYIRGTFLNGDNLVKVVFDTQEEADEAATRFSEHWGV